MNIWTFIMSSNLGNNISVVLHLLERLAADISMQKGLSPSSYTALNSWKKLGDFHGLFFFLSVWIIQQCFVMAIGRGRQQHGLTSSDERVRAGCSNVQCCIHGHLCNRGLFCVISFGKGRNYTKVNREANFKGLV